MRILLSALLTLTLVGCGDDDDHPTPDSGPGDSGTHDVDAGHTMDAGHAMDAGTADPCVVPEMGNPADSVGCNGAPLGPQDDGAFGGSCTGGTPDNPQGTCTDPAAFCTGGDGETGICLIACEPGDEYVSTGGCPMGSRCFLFEDGTGGCFPDCNSDADCSSGPCDDEASCWTPVPIDTDGGMPTDGGPPTDGGVLPDAGLPIDGGSAPDAGPVVISGDLTIHMSGFAYSPRFPTIRTGSHVTWMNDDPFGHTATSDTGVWDTGTIASGGTSDPPIAFDTVGSFPYHCLIHGMSMNGTITVVP